MSDLTQPASAGFLLADASPKFVGHYSCDVYEGDIRRAPLPLLARLWNAWADARWKLFRIPSSHYHHAQVLNRKVDHFEGTNLVVTVGKQMIMDRLYGLSAVGAM